MDPRSIDPSSVPRLAPLKDFMFEVQELDDILNDADEVAGDGLLDLPCGPLEVSVLGQPGTAPSEKENTWVNDERLVGPTEPSFPNFICVQRKAPWNGYFFRNSSPGADPDELWIRTTQLRGELVRFFKATDVDDARHSPFKSDLVDSAGRPASTTIGHVALDADFWGRVFQNSSKPPKGRVWSPRARFRNKNETIYLHPTGAMSDQDFAVTLAYLCARRRGDAATPIYRTNVLILSGDMFKPRDAASGAGPFADTQKGRVKLIRVGSSPLGLYDTYVDEDHPDAGDDKMCQATIEGLSRAQVERVYARVMQALVTKYQHLAEEQWKANKEAASALEPPSQEAVGKKGRAGKKRALDDKDSAVFRELFHSMPTALSGQPDVSAPLNARMIYERSPVAPLGTVKRGITQKDVMGGVSATDVGRPPCGVLRPLRCERLLTSTQIFRGLFGRSPPDDNDSEDVEWLHRVAFSMSFPDFKPASIVFGKTRTWNVTAQVSDNLIYGTKQCNTQMMRYAHLLFGPVIPPVRDNIDSIP
jgi:hypothetical protein